VRIKVFVCLVEVEEEVVVRAEEPVDLGMGDDAPRLRLAQLVCLDQPVLAPQVITIEERDVSPDA
jgi:hypothetical protein